MKCVYLNKCAIVNLCITLWPSDVCIFVCVCLIVCLFTEHRGLGIQTLRCQSVGMNWRLSNAFRCIYIVNQIKLHELENGVYEFHDTFSQRKNRQIKIKELKYNTCKRCRRWKSTCYLETMTDTVELRPGKIMTKTCIHMECVVWISKIASQWWNVGFYTHQFLGGWIYSICAWDSANKYRV